MTSNTSKKIMELGVKAILDKKAENLKILDISEISSVSDIMVIASGSNANQLHAMADELVEKLGKAGYRHLSYEGYDKANWVLIDYNDVIFHLFDRESRDFYKLERLYVDGINISDSEAGITD